MMTKITQYSILLLFLFCSCKEDDFDSFGQFQVSVQGMNLITFYNPECEFGNFDMNQSQFFGGVGIDLYQYFSSYWNDYSPDSILNKIWIGVRFFGPDHSLEFITNTLEHEHDSNDNAHFFVEIQMELNGIRYTNNLIDQDPHTVGWETDDACYYSINLFDVDYHSDCLNEDLMAINLNFHGKLYAYDFHTKIDSIEVQGDNLNLLFARN